MSQREAGEQGVPKRMLVAVLLMQFAVEGDLGMKFLLGNAPFLGKTSEKTERVLFESERL